MSKYPDPTPEEIVSRAAQIRAKWDERRWRLADPQAYHQEPPWTVPVIETDERIRSIVGHWEAFE